MKRKEDAAKEYVEKNPDSEVRRMYGHHYRSFMAGANYSDQQSRGKDELLQKIYNHHITNWDYRPHQESAEWEQIKKEYNAFFPQNGISLVKGAYLGLCNRSACLKPGADWYNHSTRLYYCRECARLINDHNRKEAHEMFGHELCTHGEANPEVKNTLGDTVK